MEHIVVLIEQLVYFSALHPLHLTIDDRGKTTRMERMGVAGSNVDEAPCYPLSFGVRVLNETCLPLMYRGAPAGLARTSPD